MSDNEIDTKPFVDFVKQNRQQLKFQCLQLAHNNQELSDEIVKRAKEYYKFVRG